MKTRTFNLKEIAEILTDQKITKLEIGYKTGREKNLRMDLESVSKLLMSLFPEWERRFKEKISLDEFNKLQEDSLKYVKEKYIKFNGFDTQLSFVKKEKLLDIVDFPDFSQLTNILNDLISRRSKSSIWKFFSFKELFDSKGVIPANADSLIKDSCKVFLEGRSHIERYLGFFLYIESFKLFKKPFVDFSWVNINQRLIGANILSNAPDPEKKDPTVDVNLLLKRIGATYLDESAIYSNESDIEIIGIK